MYKALAEFYDRFMLNVDYEKWLDYVVGFIGDRRSGVDLACGSGKFTMGLAKRGYEIYGIDLSQQMLNVALEESMKQGLRLNFIRQDITNLQLMKKVDFITVMCDGMNYIPNCGKVFQNIYNGLNDGGVLIFDISSEYKLSEILGNNTYSDSYGDITYIWNNYYNKKKSCIEMSLTFFKMEGKFYTKMDESQIQYLHSQTGLLAELKLSGFKNVKSYSEMSRKKVTSKDERIHFVAYK